MSYITKSEKPQPTNMLQPIKLGLGSNIWYKVSFVVKSDSDIYISATELFENLSPGGATLLIDELKLERLE